MSVEKMRSEFEAWVLSEYQDQHMGQFATGEYHSITVEHCWKSWHASRSALVIELPDTFEKRDVRGLDYDETVESIEKEGLKVKHHD